MFLRKEIAIFLLGLFILSCSGDKSINNQANPPAPIQKPTLEKPNAAFKIGFIQKKFFEMDTVACINDKNNNESIVTFKSRESGATLSFRMLNFGGPANSHTLVNGKSKGVVFLSLGGEKNTNIFSLTKDPSNCVVNYQFKEFQMQASFQCQNISNAQGQSVTAEGSWLCNTQTQKDWSW